MFQFSKSICSINPQWYHQHFLSQSITWILLSSVCSTQHLCKQGVVLLYRPVQLMLNMVIMVYNNNYSGGVHLLSVTCLACLSHASVKLLTSYWQAVASYWHAITRHLTSHLPPKWCLLHVQGTPTPGRSFIQSSHGELQYFKWPLRASVTAKYL